MKTPGPGFDSLGQDLRRLLGSAKVKTDPEDLLAYSSDATRYYAQGNPQAVVLAGCVDDVCQVLKYANRQEIPLTPRGAGSGLSGGSTPIRGGIVLDMKRMNKILEINKGNMTARAESGVVLANFHRAVEKERLFYPPDPQSMDVCTLGGNVACRAGGPRGVKYGTTPNYVLGLEAVLPDGSVINTGGISVKQANGYNLTQILTGSEGTLAVITKVNLRLLTLPPGRKTAVIVCDSPQIAAELVSRIIYEGAVPAVLEYLSVGAIWLMNSYCPIPVAVRADHFATNGALGSQISRTCVGSRGLSRPSDYNAVFAFSPVLVIFHSRISIFSSVSATAFRNPSICPAVQHPTFSSSL